MDVEPTLLAEPNVDDADSLVSSNDPDDMENEQTWPTEDEMQDASRIGDDQPEIPSAKNGTTPKSVKIPKGMSAYQAAWIVDEEDDVDGEDREGEEDEGEGDEMMTDEEGEPEEMVDLAEVQEMESESRKSVAFQDLDVEEEERQ